MALESLNSVTEEAMSELLKSLDQTCLVSPAMMEQVSSDFNELSD